MHKSGSGLNSNSVPLGGGAEAKWSPSNWARLVRRAHTGKRYMYNLFILLLCVTQLSQRRYLLHQGTKILYLLCDNPFIFSSLGLGNVNKLHGSQKVLCFIPWKFHVSCGNCLKRFVPPQLKWKVCFTLSANSKIVSQEVGGCVSRCPWQRNSCSWAANNPLIKIKWIEARK